jgi:putative membrane protein
MRIPLSILTAIAAALAVMFAIPNRGAVTLRLWPLAGEAEMPLYLAVFAAVFLGFFLGWIGSWIAQHKWRKRAREQARRIEKLEREILGAAEAAGPKTPEVTKIPAIPLRR